MITIKTADEIALMADAGSLLHQVLQHLKTLVKPGVTTKYIDSVAEQMIRDNGAIPSFKGYGGFPASICASVDDTVVHGFPDDKPLAEGSILSIDCGLILKGWQSDSALTVPVGEINKEKAKLIRVTEECFWLGANMAREGNRLGDIGHAVQEHAEKNGYGVIRDMTGHGIGREMHEDPSVPNYGHAGKGVRLRKGMVLAIEPMICTGNWQVYINEWICRTRDHSPCSHYEHTVAITDGEPLVLSCPGADVRRFLK